MVSAAQNNSKLLKGNLNLRVSNYPSRESLSQSVAYMYTIRIDGGDKAKLTQFRDFSELGHFRCLVRVQCNRTITKCDVFYNGPAHLLQVFLDFAPVSSLRALERGVLPDFRGSLHERIAAVSLQRRPMVTVALRQLDLNFRRKNFPARLKNKNEVKNLSQLILDIEA